MTEGLFALGGVALGVILTEGFNAYRESRQRQREDQTRFVAEKRALFASFLSTTWRLSAVTSLEAHGEAGIEAARLFQELTLIAGSDAQEAASSLLKSCDARFLLSNSGIGTFETRQKNVEASREAYSAFLVAARRELRVEAKD